MKIVCAPDSFKETLSAVEVALAPIADGGEGTIDALVGAMGGEIHRARVAGPRGGEHEVEARFGVGGDGNTGIVELAEASGLALLSVGDRNPMRTTTYGTGQLISAAMDADCVTIILGLGGSATVDGGAGIAQALGARFIDSDGRAIDEPITGGLLMRIARVEAPPANCVPLIRVACDVTNPLCGRNGAAAVYGPQKGATPEQVKEIDAGLASLARVLGADPDTPGFGAAGGAALCLVALCGATVQRGIDLVLDEVHFRKRCAGADLVLTGEGRLDAQSLHGKATMGVAHAAGECGVGTIAIVGSAGDGAERTLHEHGGALAGFESLADRFGMERAMAEPRALIVEVSTDCVQKLMRG